MPEYTLSPVGESDRTGIVDIFNHYVEHTFAAYPEEKVPYAFFDLILGITRDYPVVTVRDAAGEVAGFGMLRPHNPMPAFARTAEITYFLRPDQTGRGTGSAVLGECGRFRNVGSKRGVLFDTVWMQKEI